ncbi:hypothetical protein [Pyrobaculum ferrireducens]|uniref:Ferritin-like domain-containing protein n=1 Tax=Pyrobaculum ferrireducens TaxID=1104324 RepID=G7VHK2_9CREN|nr:hypothetical protein [Pyrobaculum ferrireducens]AET33293.1 hypothetical protein P186_1891 [Pyrobaculum ferrireducens]
MSVGEKLWAEVPRLRKIWEDLKNVGDDVLRQFSTPQEFIDWFKAYADPVLQFHYVIGHEWGATTDVDGVRSWLRQGVWNEWAAAADVAKMVTEYRDLIDTEFMTMLAQQISDEGRHLYLRSRILRAFGGSMEGFQPIKEWVELFELPFVCAPKNMKFFQVRATSTLQVVELTSVYHHRGVHDALPKNRTLMEGPYRSAAVMLQESFREIEDDELFHWSIAERVWMKYAKDPEAMRNILDCAAEALRVSTEARVRRVELAEKKAI